VFTLYYQSDFTTQMISTPYPAMEEDDDWLNDSSGPNQGGATDPLTNVEYDRLASKYSDVRFSFFLLPSSH